MAVSKIASWGFDSLSAHQDFPAVAQFGETRRSQKPLFMVVRIHPAGPIYAQVTQLADVPA